MAPESFETLVSAEKPRKKLHYVGLDGLRGVAAVMVLCVHTTEPFFLNATSEQPLYHAYLAVDFFYVLSGFVIAHAYDDRWERSAPRLTVREFLRRRVIRLQPMAVLGMLIGALLFYFQSSSTFPLIAEMPVWRVVITFVLGSLMIPSTKKMDIRGWEETFPLNGPTWTLFYEYFANVLYAVVLRRLTIRGLSIVTGAASILVMGVCLWAPSGDGGVAGGWVLEPTHVLIAFTRLCYPFCCGILLCRLQKCSSLWRPKVNNPLLISVLLLVVVLAFPYPGGTTRNGIYEAFCILFGFPIIMMIGAECNQENTDPESRIFKLSSFLGGLSYPLYLTHMPFAYIYMNAVNNGLVERQNKLRLSVVFFTTAMCAGYLSWKYFDEPVRVLLNRR